ncbi:MAG TPA: GNAT family protein [Patescibacteria group bacterium]|nr:GNAT family protein [Patescibacteria group bacterium]
MKQGRIVFRGKTKAGKVFIFRYPERGDVVILTEYINKLSKEQTFIGFQGEQISQKQEKEYLNKFLKKIKNREAVQLYAFVGSELIGVSSIELSERSVHKHLGAFGISIAKEYRNQGIGRKFMEKVMGEAKKNLPGLEIITLTLFANNPIALKLYRNFGFKEFGRLPKGVIHRGKFVDHLHMYKKI